MRDKLKNHSLKLAIYSKYAGKIIDHFEIEKELKNCLEKSQFGNKTWTIYANRLTNFLIVVGFLMRAGRKLIVQDLGAPIVDRDAIASRGKQRGKVFSVSVSPFMVCSELEKLERGICDIPSIQRNALSVMKRFELVTIDGKKIVLNSQSVSKYGGIVEAVWLSAKNESSIGKCMDILNSEPNISSVDLASKICHAYDLNWSKGSLIRNGGILKQWARWVKQGIKSSSIPCPPGRARANKRMNEETSPVGPSLE